MASKHDEPEKPPTATKPDTPIPTSEPATFSKQDTPGRPKSSGSRQQTHPDQQTQTGSPDLDSPDGQN
jgi:hypothetical protein